MGGEAVGEVEACIDVVQERVLLSWSAQGGGSSMHCYGSVPWVGSVGDAAEPPHSRANSEVTFFSVFFPFSRLSFAFTLMDIFTPGPLLNNSIQLRESMGLIFRFTSVTKRNHNQLKA